MRQLLLAAILFGAGSSAAAQQKPAAPTAPSAPAGSLDLRPIGLQQLSLGSLSYTPLALPRLDFGTARQAAPAEAAAPADTSMRANPPILSGGTTPFLVMQAAPPIVSAMQPFGSSMITFDLTAPKPPADRPEPRNSYEAYRQKVWDQFNYTPPAASGSRDPFLTGTR
jgi:hypothetical protein